MIREVGEAVGNAVLSSVGRAMGRAQERRPLNSDLLESEEAYLVVFDAPGVEAGDVQVRYEDGTVHVRLDRYRGRESGFEMRFPGRGLTLSGRRSIPSDAVVDPEAASATLTANGTLQIRVPKAADGEAADEEATDEEAADEEESKAADEGAAEDESDDE